MTDKGLELIKHWEGCSLTAYKCSAGKWTIGYGATHYVNGTPVKEGDKLKSEEEASDLLIKLVKTFEDAVDRLVSSNINPYQRDALISFTYNVGEYNLGRSTLLKKVNNNPNDKTIKDEFAKWVHCNKKVLKGLVTRRKAESDLYFTEWAEPLPEYNSNDPKGPFYPSDNPGKNKPSWMYQYDPDKK